MSGGPACCAQHIHALGVQLPGPATPPGQRWLLWGQAGPQAPQWLFSRDLVGSGYTETYRAANGSQVVEHPQRQVWARDSPPQGRQWAERGQGRGPLTPPPSCRVTASTRATWRDTSIPPPASAPVPASGGCRRPGGVSAIPHMLQRGKLRPRREGLSVTTFLHMGVWPVRSHRFPELQGSPWALEAVPRIPPAWGAIHPRADGASSSPEGDPLSLKGLSLPRCPCGDALIQNHLAYLCPQGLFPGRLGCPPDRAPGRGR